jgi:Zn-dependent protease
MAFITNLMLAAWIKFHDSSYITALVATLTLAIGLLAMLKSIVVWAQHLFEPRHAAHRGFDASLRGVGVGDVAGLPFDWHRQPCPTCTEPPNLPCGPCTQAAAVLQVCCAYVRACMHRANESPIRTAQKLC